MKVDNFPVMLESFLGNIKYTYNVVALQIELLYIIGIHIMQIACGGNHSMVLTASGNLYAFGKNDFGQLGLHDTIDRCFPTLIQSLQYKI